jgi:hypothetical protein
MDSLSASDLPPDSSSRLIRKLIFPDSHQRDSLIKGILWVILFTELFLSGSGAYLYLQGYGGYRKGIEDRAP